MKNLDLVQKLKSIVRKSIKKTLIKLVPELAFIGVEANKFAWHQFINKAYECKISPKSKLYPPYQLDYVTIDDYSYIASNSQVSRTDIGKFCSIGMNLVCGRGIHPIKGVSTSPYFYSTNKQNGASISAVNKIEERKWITIGNDVFIGMNVTILDGVCIGDGAVIGAGAVVSKNIPPYAIAVGCPIRIIGYRFEDEIINELLEIRWWEKSDEYLRMVEAMFFEVEEFVNAVKVKDAFIDHE
ncbi:MAG: CatB-related O-acetyltransferase [Chloroflexi bacterium]|nr:antibiotic acetyltransferase [Chloroflexota bacterium]NOG76545.1 CatB-related O-acetyltransferase [Chloroflexota bacterium]